jgi:hypothetical protein
LSLCAGSKETLFDAHFIFEGTDWPLGGLPKSDEREQQPAVPGTFRSKFR